MRCESCNTQLLTIFPGNDFVFTNAKRHESEDILDKVGQPWQLNTYSHVEHGFSVRCNLEDPRQKFAKESAFFQAVAWFDEYIKASKK